MKTNMFATKERRKKVVIALSMVAVLLITGIMALFTDHEEATNVFTVGSIEIDLTEPNWVEANATEIAPNQVIAKDPMITNVGKNDAYTFIKVDIPKQDGNPLFELLDKNGNSGVNDGWVLVETGETADTITYVYGYAADDAMTRVTPTNATENLFSSVKVADVEEFKVDSCDIIVTGYGIQADDIPTAPAEVWELVKGELGVTDPSPIKIVTWADGTDEEIAAMVAAADAGEINLADYWSVGDERQVTLSAMSATGVGESHAEQTVTLVLMHQGEYELADGSTCNFVVGQKNSLAERGYMNSSDTNSGSWDGSARRAWCNSTYYDAYPAALKPIFKQFKTVTAETYNGTTLKTSVDRFALPAQKEIFGGTATSAGSGTSYSNLTEFNALNQFEYYKDSANRFKKYGDSGSDSNWWSRSPSWGKSNTFCYVGNKSGNALHYYASTSMGLAPFGCI